MSSIEVDKWRRSRKPAQIEQLLLKPQSHPAMNDMTLSIARGQAEAFPLKDKAGGGWIAKKFHPNKSMDISYLKAVNSILPKHKAFRCGTERRMLTSASLKKEPGNHYSATLAKWLEHVILMPQIEGVDWACLIGQIRDKEIVLSQSNRISLCRNLATLVRILEDNSISHRDLSNGNLFINPKTFEISLIDFDSLYHPSLTMPTATTVGSEGYIAPFVNPTRAISTYCSQADRFALAILCVEFLILNPDSPYCHEGGIFDQKDINQRCGKTISYSENKLKDYPQALKLFQSAIKSNSFQYCPSPKAWLSVCQEPKKCFSVDDLPAVLLEILKQKLNVPVTLPDNPWIKKEGVCKNGFNLQSFTRRYASVLDFHGYSFPDTTGDGYLRPLENSVVTTNHKGNRAMDEIFAKLLPKTNPKTDW